MTKRTLWDFFRKRPLLAILGLVLFALPLVVSIVQYVAGGMIIPMTAGDFILFYGAFGSLAWAVAAFVSRNEEEKRCREREYLPKFVVSASSYGRGIQFEFTNIGSHGVLDVYFEDFPLAPYMASEKSVCLRALTGPMSTSALFTEIDEDGVKGESLVSGISFGAEIREDGYPKRIYLYAVDLLERSWRLSFLHVLDGGHHYISEALEDPES